MRVSLPSVLLAGVMALNGPDHAAAQSKSSVTVNGKTVTVIGGRSRSMSTSPSGASIVLDGTRIEMSGDVLSVDGKDYPLADYREVEIESTEAGVSVRVDGETLVAPAAPSSSLRERAEAGDAAAQRDLGVDYYTGDGVEKDLEAAFDWTLKAGEQGDRFAQRNLGVMYLNGEGVARDPAKAVEWYRKAAEQGLGDAANSVGRAYKLGEGVEADEAQAVEWYRRSAEAGNRAGQFNYGIAVLYGDGGLDADPSASLDLMRKSAAQDYAPAINSVGLAYARGEAVEQDFAEARRWYERAAAMGNEVSMRNLGTMAENGEGMAVDLAEARLWYEKAAEAGDGPAGDALARLDAASGASDGPPALPETRTGPPALPSAEYWIEEDGKPVGPLDEAAIRARLSDGRADAATLVWSKGLGDWTPVGETPLGR